MKLSISVSHVFYFAHLVNDAEYWSYGQGEIVDKEELYQEVKANAKLPVIVSTSKFLQKCTDAEGNFAEWAEHHGYEPARFAFLQLAPGAF